MTEEEAHQLMLRMHDKFPKPKAIHDMKLQRRRILSIKEGPPHLYVMSNEVNYHSSPRSTTNIETTEATNPDESNSCVSVHYQVLPIALFNDLQISHLTDSRDVRLDSSRFD